MLLLAACSGGSDATATTASTSVAPSTTTAAPTTSTPSSLVITTAVSTTSSVVVTTTTAPTTDAPTSTAPSAEAAVRQAIQDYLAAYIACGQTPASCQPNEFAAPESEALRNLDGFVDHMVTREYRFSPDTRGTRIIPVSVEVAGDGATTVSCFFDGLIALGPDGPDGNPTVVDDRTATRRSEHQWKLIDGVWLVEKATTLENLGTDDQCG